jgi:predicted component of type VI protein secretion system
MKKIEAKVQASAWAALLVGALVGILNQVAGDNQLLGSLPPLAQTVITVGVPPLVVFLSGWVAKHTPRPPAPPQ